MRAIAADALAVLNYQGSLDIQVSRLSFAERQLVTIARALSQQSRVLILDEPTASLEAREAEKLFAALERLKAQRVAIVFVSHRLDEVVRLSDRCTTLRDGRVVDVSRKGQFDQDRLVQLMTGEDADELRRVHAGDFGAPLLRHQENADQPSNQDITLREGETIGPGRIARQRHHRLSKAVVWRRRPSG